MTNRLAHILLLVPFIVMTIGCRSSKDDAKVQASQVAPSSTPQLEYMLAEGATPAVFVAGHPLVYTRQILAINDDQQLVGPDSPAQQIDQVLKNLERVLQASGSDLDQLVKVNAYGDSATTLDQFQAALSDCLPSSLRPAICRVVSPLPIDKAAIAVDVVAVTKDPIESLELVSGDDSKNGVNCADAVRVPGGGVVFLSGQPDKSPLAEATANAMTTLLDVMSQLQIAASQIIQLKVFIDSASQTNVVLEQLQELFPDRTLPPVSFVEWIASAPVEIEAVAHFPRESWKSSERLHFFTPDGVNPSPTFSRVAVLQTDHQIFLSGLLARDAASGEQQVRDVYAQLQDILQETGSDLTHLAKATYYVSDQDASDKLNELRPEFYAPDRPPAASKAMVHDVGQADRTFSMDMIAVKAGE